MFREAKAARICRKAYQKKGTERQSSRDPQRCPLHGFGR